MAIPVEIIQGKEEAGWYSISKRTKMTGLELLCARKRGSSWWDALGTEFQFIGIFELKVKGRGSAGRILGIEVVLMLMYKIR